MVKLLGRIKVGPLTVVIVYDFSCHLLRLPLFSSSSGYNTVVRIPAGATNIDIKQVSYSGKPEDDNYLGECALHMCQCRGAVSDDALSDCMVFFRESIRHGSDPT